ncbi:hypothetical protein JOC77_001047 [Peribacillus deserti]|uniref:Sigma-70 family RNA polymerase sigma factor n=1 Tax=Peribacillus deserti TaxID=673318 RepID=A0ABS2QEQ9_9BACI|nr:hypothetical protein [Peribacillus deserti]MBM7691640.1 hypothetical protein [Peribacillus deserti]
MKREEVEHILREKYAEYTEKIIRNVKRLNYGTLLSGEESELENAWEEFVYQVQEEESIYYEKTIRQFIFHLLQSLPRSELKLLWLTTENYYEYDDTGFPSADEVIEAVEDEMYSYIERKASKGTLIPQISTSWRNRLKEEEDEV